MFFFYIRFRGSWYIIRGNTHMSSCLYYTSTVLSAELQPLEAGPLGLLQSHSNDATCGRCQLSLGRLQLCTHLEPQQRGKSGKKHWDDLMPKFGQDGRMWQTWTYPGHIGCMGPISSYFHAETIGPIGMSMASLFSVPCDIRPSWTRQALASALSLPGIGTIPCYVFRSAWASHTRKAKRMSCCRWKRLKGHDRRCDRDCRDCRDCHDSWHGWDMLGRSQTKSHSSWASTDRGLFHHLQKNKWRRNMTKPLRPCWKDLEVQLQSTSYAWYYMALFLISTESKQSSSLLPSVRCMCVYCTVI